MSSRLRSTELRGSILRLCLRSLMGAMAAAAAAAPAADPSPRVYFGDLHVHTRISADSFLRRNRVGMEEAYRFARGGAVELATGVVVQLQHPLDFVALTDHSESFSTYAICVEGTGAYAETPECLALKSGDLSLMTRMAETAAAWPPHRNPDSCPGGVEGCTAAAKAVWSRVRTLADQFNDPGRFTTFIAYEYSAMLPGPGHLHRNIIFRGSAVPDVAMSSLDLPRNVELWKWLEESCRAPCDVLAIPHNTNLSWGLFFALETRDGQRYTDQDLARRARYETLAEIFQIKGASECAVGLGTSDEQCAFNQFLLQPCTPERTTNCAAAGSFVRNALKTGLAIAEERGVNPYQLGFIGSTDTHNGIPGATAELGYPGSVGVEDGSPEQRTTRHLYRNPGGLAGVWARENNRDALFDAMKRRETFATSGTRIAVRFFAGWELPGGLATRPDFVGEAYRLGVPMGGDLRRGPAGKAPRFLVWAARDPDGVGLRAIHIVKGWHGRAGDDERIYDVACSDGLVPDPATHRCPDNGASASLTDCSVTAGKGADQLAATWEDPEFDPDRAVFYYLRVLENPSCRSSTWDALALGRTPAPVPAPIQQERAWSSPIWYQP